jgi:hypothetical protein
MKPTFANVLDELRDLLTMTKPTLRGLAEDTEPDNVIRFSRWSRDDLLLYVLEHHKAWDEN